MDIEHAAGARAVGESVQKRNGGATGGNEAAVDAVEPKDSSARFAANNSSRRQCTPPADMTQDRCCN